jgi:hypothetical protein
MFEIVQRVGGREKEMDLERKIGLHDNKGHKRL